MSPTYGELVDKLAATCISIHNDTPRPLHNNDGKINETLILHHDALLALRISNLPCERQRAICQAANPNFDSTVAVSTCTITEQKSHSNTISTLPLLYPPSKIPQSEAEACEDQNLVFRLRELKPEEVKQAVVDVVGKIMGGLLGNGRTFQRNRRDGAESEGEVEHERNAEQVEWYRQRKHQAPQGEVAHDEMVSERSGYNNDGESN